MTNQESEQEKTVGKANKHNFGYVPALDGIRAFAVIAVMMYHARFAKGGFIGVDIFFVLSGFLITSLLVREFDSQLRIDLRKFYFRRLLRLAPALVLFLTIFASISMLVLDADKSRSNLIDTFIALFYLSNWAWAFQIHPPHFLAHTWSLSIEEQFYILWPVILIGLLRFSRSRQNVVVVVTLLALSSTLVRVFLAIEGSSFIRLFNGLDTRADALLIGSLFGVITSSNLISDHHHHQFAKFLKFIGPLSLIALVNFCIFARDNIQLYCWQLFTVEILAAIIILDVVVSPQSVVNQVFTFKPLVWIGSISYGLYLWHFPIYKVMRLLGFDGIGVASVGTSLTFLIASASYYFVERPFLKLKNP
jgi:peptidoglycan/LPS O-acetylase OafA/YrhL